MTILNRLDNELRYVHSMKTNSANFEEILNQLIPIVVNTSEDSIPDSTRDYINAILRDIDRFYGRIPPDEAWLYRDKAALDVVKKGLADTNVTPFKEFNKINYAYKTVEEYEDIVGFKVSEAFRIGWDMARTTDEMLNQLAINSERPEADK